MLAAHAIIWRSKSFYLDKEEAGYVSHIVHLEMVSPRGVKMRDLETEKVFNHNYSRVPEGGILQDELRVLPPEKGRKVFFIESMEDSYTAFLPRTEVKWNALQLREAEGELALLEAQRAVLQKTRSWASLGKVAEEIRLIERMLEKARSLQILPKNT